MHGAVLKEVRDANFCYGYDNFLNAWRENDVQALDDAWDIERHGDAYPGGGLALLVKIGYVDRAELRRACMLYVHEWIEGRAPYSPRAGTRGLHEVLSWLVFRENASNRDVRTYVLEVATRTLWKIGELSSESNRLPLYRALLSLLVAVGAPYPQIVRDTVGKVFGVHSYESLQEFVHVVMFAETSEAWSSTFDTYVIGEIAHARRALLSREVAREKRLQMLHQLIALLYQRYRRPLWWRGTRGGEGVALHTTERKVWNVLHNQGIVFASSRFLTEEEVVYALKSL